MQANDVDHVRVSQDNRLMLKNITDHLGIVTACICVFHCIALPFILLASAWSGSETFHLWSLVITVIITGHALWHGYKTHCKHIVLSLGGLGMGTLMLGVGLHFILHDHYHGHIDDIPLLNAEQIATVIGSVLILSAHIINIRYKSLCCTTK